MEALKPGDDPNVTFSLGDDKAVAVWKCQEMCSREIPKI
jgi:hypothetical protein